MQSPPEPYYLVSLRDPDISGDHELDAHDQVKDASSALPTFVANTSTPRSYFHSQLGRSWGVSDDHTASHELDKHLIASTPTKVAVHPRLSTRPQLLWHFLIIAPYLAAAALAVMHHFYLRYLEGEAVPEETQRYYKDGSNALATVTQYLLIISTTSALTQVIWYHLQRSAHTISTVDGLFGLPSILPMLSLTFSSASLVIPSTLAVAALSHALLCISIFAPNSLTIYPAGDTTQTITVPSFPSANNLFQTAVSAYQDPKLKYTTPTYIGPTPDWVSAVKRAVTSPNAISTWQVPEECGIECHYDLTYEAPMIDCSDLSADDILFYEAPDKASSVLFTAVSSIGRWNEMNADTKTTASWVWSSQDYWNPSGDWTTQHDITFRYIEDYSDKTKGGSHCTFYEGEYTASFHFVNNTQTVGATVNHRGKALGDPQWSFIDKASGERILDDSLPITFTYSKATYHATIEAFAQVLVGTASGYGLDKYSANGIDVNYFHTSIGDTPFFSVTYEPNTGGEVWTLATPDMSQSLMDLFTNMTLSFNSQSTRQSLNLENTTQVLATVTTNGSVWQYSQSRLWSVYGTFLFFVAICDIYGLVCLWSNGIPGNMTFSHIALASETLHLTTSGSDISPLSHELTEKAKRMKIRYGLVDDTVLGSRNGFKVVRSDDDGDGEK